MVLANHRWFRFLAVTWLAVGQNRREAGAALGLIVRGKRLRGWNRLCTLAQASAKGYQAWTSLSEPSAGSKYLQREGVDLNLTRFIPIIVCDRASSTQGTAATTASLRLAFGPDAMICVAAPPTAQASGLVRLPGADLAEALHQLQHDHPDGWIVPVCSGDRVAVLLGAALAQAACSVGQKAMVYWDEDQLAGDRRSLPWVKPDWDPLLNINLDMLSGACALSLASAAEVLSRSKRLACDPAGFADLIAAAAADQSIAKPVHVPMILVHREGRRGDFGADRIGARLASHYPEFELSPSAGKIGARYVQPRAPAAWPKVSILIPTRDRADLLAACLAGLERLDYPGAHEVMVIDNESSDPALFNLLDRLELSGRGSRRSVGGSFNFSRLNNIAARYADGEMLCLLNNDIEPLDGQWLEAMVRHACRAGVGAVGARLLYPDGTVQHAGVAIGIGDAAGHVQKGVEPGRSDHPTWVNITRQVSAVTAACMVVRRDHYLAVGGLDEECFAVAFNDVDFCLRSQAAGLDNVYVAQATLMHHESKSRGRDDTPANAKRFAAELAALRQRWDTVSYRDPYFSPLFSRTSERCLLAF